jgi:hypothetical protein
VSLTCTRVRPFAGLDTRASNYWTTSHSGMPVRESLLSRHPAECVESEPTVRVPLDVLILDSHVGEPSCHELINDPLSVVGLVVKACVPCCIGCGAAQVCLPDGQCLSRCRCVGDVEDGQGFGCFSRHSPDHFTCIPERREVEENASLTSN